MLPGLPDFLIGYFTGCIRDLAFNNQSVTFLNSSSAQLGVTIRSVDVQSGCIGREVCRNISCPRNAFCSDDWNVYSCPCREGWIGADCNTSTYTCYNHRCNNGATCLNATLGYNCSCPLGNSSHFKLLLPL